METIFDYPPYLQVFFVVTFFGAVIHALGIHLICERVNKWKQEGRSHTFLFTVLNVMSQLNLVFIIWLTPALAGLLLYYGPDHILDVLNSADTKEPIATFTFIFLALSPHLQDFFFVITRRVSRLFGGGIRAWWITALVLGAILSGLISEASLMVLLCSTLATRVFSLKPSKWFCYWTLATVLVVMSMGNLILPFNITTALDLSSKWGWTHWTILESLSWRVLVATVFLLVGMVILLRKEFVTMEEAWKESLKKAPDELKIGSILYALLLVFAGTFKDIQLFMIILVSVVCIAEPEPKGKRLSARLKLPLLIALFNYSLELHAFFLADSVKYLYDSIGSNSYGFASLVLSGLNEHLPGPSFVSSYQTINFEGQSTGLLALATGGGLTLFATSVNVEAYKILKPSFPDQIIKVWKLCLYSIPLDIAAYLILRLTF